MNAKHDSDNQCPADLLDLEWTLGTALDRYPALREVLVAQGFVGLAGSQPLPPSWGNLRLVDLARYRGLAPHEFQGSLRGGLAAVREEPSRPDVVAFFPCPVKVPLEQAFAAASKTLAIDDVRWSFEGNVNKNPDDYAELLKRACAGDMPDVLVTPGVNHLYSREFMERVIDSGEFVDAADYARADRPESVFRDPRGHCTVLAANVTLMAVDESKLEGRPMPRRWSDLLGPEWSSSVVMRGDGKTFCETNLLTWYSLFGSEPLRNLRRAIRDGWHPSRIAKAMSSGGANAPAVGILPWMFAATIKGRERVTIVWPEDGAIVSPVTLLMHGSARPSVRRLAAWLAGPEAAAAYSAARFPTPHPAVASILPHGASLAWVGWDFLRSHDVPALIAEVEGLFGV